jgi:hypothetical protein
MMSRVRKFGARNILTDVVASVLEDLGFRVKVEYVVFLEKNISYYGKYTNQIVADVLGEKIVEDLKFTVYVSCFNRTDKAVAMDEIKTEYEVIRNMSIAPNVRVLVANSFSENVKKRAIEYGFVAIEIGETVTENNAEKAYLKVYGKLNKLFTEVSPKWMQDFVENIKKLTDEIKKNLGET